MDGWGGGLLVWEVCRGFYVPGERTGVAMTGRVRVVRVKRVRMVNFMGFLSVFSFFFSS